ncbi:hypothetical protein Droror1_Dr00018402 [Drosera rotundifolia]
MSKKTKKIKKTEVVIPSRRKITKGSRTKREILVEEKKEKNSYETEKNDTCESSEEKDVYENEEAKDVCGSEKKRLIVSLTRRMN